MAPVRIAVLGAGGFLGSHLVPALVARFGCEVIAVDVDLHKLETTSPCITPVRARIEEPGLVESITGNCELVISLTALCNPALYSTIPLEVIDASYTHLLPLVQACASRAIRLIHFSTAEVYGRMALDASGQRTEEMNEETSGLFLGPVNRERWSYACAKQLLERVIWAHGHHGNLPFTIIRPFNIIGARMDYLSGVDGEGIPRVLASFMSSLLRGQELPLVDGGHQKRSFMATSDLAEAICRVVERPDACRGQIFNLGNPRNNLSIRELGQAMADVFAKRVPDAPPARFRNVPAAEFYGSGYDDSEERIPDISKAGELLDWAPRESLADMLPSIVDDYVVRYGSLLPEPMLAPPVKRASVG
jgi:UDP-apiose/xylose synthase